VYNIKVSFLIYITNSKDNSICYGECSERSVCIVRQFFIDLSDAPKYGIICTENRDVLDSFIPEILTFKECSKRVHYVLDTLWIFFECHIFGRKLSIKFSFSVQIMPYLGSLDRPIKNWLTLLLVIVKLIVFLPKNLHIWNWA